MQGRPGCLHVQDESASAVCLQAFRKSESILGNNKQTMIADFAPDKKVILLESSLQAQTAKCGDVYVCMHVTACGTVMLHMQGQHSPCNLLFELGTLQISIHNMSVMALLHKA